MKVSLFKIAIFSLMIHPFFNVNATDLSQSLFSEVDQAWKSIRSQSHDLISDGNNALRSLMYSMCVFEGILYKRAQLAARSGLRPFSSQIYVPDGQLPTEVDQWWQRIHALSHHLRPFDDNILQSLKYSMRAIEDIQVEGTRLSLIEYARRQRAFYISYKDSSFACYNFSEQLREKENPSWHKQLLDILDSAQGRDIYLTFKYFRGCGGGPMKQLNPGSQIYKYFESFNKLDKHDRGQGDTGYEPLSESGIEGVVKTIISLADDPEVKAFSLRNTGIKYALNLIDELLISNSELRNNPAFAEQIIAFNNSSYIADSFETPNKKKDIIYRLKRIRCYGKNESR
jgi:hypothetical protein